MLRVDNISYGPTSLFNIQSNISFHIDKGEMLHIVGTNGVGKSVLAKILAGYHNSNKGSISNQFSKISYLPQQQNKSAHLPFTIRDILSFVDSDEQAWLKIKLLDSHHLPLAWNKASGGERQRTLLTRLFLEKSDLYIIDEPFNHLDTEAKEKVKKSILSLMQQNLNLAVVLVSHDDNPKEWMNSILVKTLELRDRNV